MFNEATVQASSANTIAQSAAIVPSGTALAGAAGP